jgi:flagellar biosynthetic protein FliQ
MTDTQVLEIALQAIIVTGKLAAPILLVTLAMGFLISLFQSVTQIQEVTLSFVPKLAGVAVVFLVAGNWMLAELVNFTQALFDGIPRLLGA